jgi:hypothetical protein
MGNAQAEPERVDRVEMDIVVSEIVEENFDRHNLCVCHVETNVLVDRIMERYDYDRTEVKESVIERVRDKSHGPRNIFVSRGGSGKVELMDWSQEQSTEEHLFPDE